MKVDKREFDQLIEDLKDLPKEALDDALPFYKSNTPIDKGNARSKTRLRGKNKIHSDYPYAGRLDDGWSKQAPKGFTDPTIEHIEEFVEKAIKKL